MGTGVNGGEAGEAPELSLVIPVYNEEAILEQSLEELCDRLDEHGIDYEVVVAENGSRDRTVEIGEQVAAGQDAAPEFGEGERGETEQERDEQVDAIVEHAGEAERPADQDAGEDEGEEDRTDPGGLPQHGRAAFAPRTAGRGRSGDLLLQRLEEPRAQDVDERPDDGQAAVGLIADRATCEDEEPVGAQPVDRETERDGGRAIGQRAAFTHALEKRADDGGSRSADSPEIRAA